MCFGDFLMMISHYTTFKITIKSYRRKAQYLQLIFLVLYYFTTLQEI